MNNLFNLLRKFITELNSSNSSNDKKLVIKRFCMYENIRQVLIYTFHPLWNYYVTPSALNKKAASLNRGQRILSPVTLFSLLDDLRERKVTGDSAIEYIWSFINNILNMNMR